jgi:hypothetical protein
MEGSYKLMLMDTETKKKGQIYDEDSIVEQGIRAGIISGAGAHWKCLGEEYKGKSAIERRMLLEPEFKKKVREAVLAVLLAL